MENSLRIRKFQSAGRPQAGYFSSILKDLKLNSSEQTRIITPFMFPTYSQNNEERDIKRLFYHVF